MAGLLLRYLSETCAGFCPGGADPYICARCLRSEVEHKCEVKV